MKAFRWRGLVSGLLLGLIVASPVHLRAASYFWDSNGTTGGAGITPSGTWGTSNFWNTSSTGGSGSFITTSGSTDTLCFVAGPSSTSGTNAYTVSVSDNQNANGLLFQSSGAATLSGTGAINLWGGGITVSKFAFSTTSQGAVTISSQIILQGAQTWSNSSSNPLSINGSIVNGGNLLTIGGPGYVAFPGNLSGSGGLTKTGTGMLSLQSASTFSGTTSVSGGTLNLSHASALQSSTLVAPTGGSIVFDQNVGSRIYNIGALSGSGNLVLQNNATTPAAVTLSSGGNNATTIYAGLLSGPGMLVKIGSGSLTLTGTNDTYSGGSTITSGLLVLTNSGALPSYSTSAAKLSVAGSGTLVLNLGGTGWTAANVGSLLAANGGGFAPGSTLSLDTTNAAGTTTLSFVVAGNLGLAKLGANSLSLSAANTYSGTTTVSAGTLNLANANALQGSTLIAPTVGTLAFDPSVHAFSLGGLYGSGNLGLQNGAALALTVGGNGASTVYAGVLSGSGSLVKTGSGALVLIGANSFSGGTTIGSGALQLGDGTSGHDGVLAASGGISDGASLVFNLFSAQTYAGVISGSGAVTKAGTGLLVLTNTESYTGGTTISGGTLQLGDGTSGHNGVLAATGGILNNATLAYNLYGSQTYAGAISGSGSLIKYGSNSLTLTGSSAFLGTISVSAGTLDLCHSAALQSGTLIAPTAGRLVFDAGVTGRTFTLGGLSGSGNIALQNNAAAAVALTVGGNNTSTVYSGNLSGSGALTKIGAGTWTLTSSDGCNGLSVSDGGLVLAGTGSLTTGGTGNLFIGMNRSAAVTLQDTATLKVGGNLELNYQNTTGGASTLTLTGGSLAVAGSTYIGEAVMRTGPGTTSAAFYVSGGTANLTGPVTVGDYGTATSLLDISGGSLAASSGLVVGSHGNGAVNIHGSAAVQIKGGDLVIGSDSTQATGGSLGLSGGTLAVTGNMDLAMGGGIGVLSRSGGVLTVSGSLSIGGTAQVILDGTVASAATTFSGIGHTAGSTLVVVPQTGNLGTTESLGFVRAPALTNGILGPWAVLAASGTNSAGDYLTTTGTGTRYLAVASYSSSNFTGSSGTTVVSVASSGTLASNTTAYAVKFGPAATTIASTASLTISSGGMILNGGTISGGGVAIPTGIAPLVYAGGSVPGRIASAITSDSGLTKFGPGSLVLSGSNSSLRGKIAVNAGTVRAQSAAALGQGGADSSVTVAAGASLEIQGNTTIANVPIRLNGIGVNGGGALRNVQDNNTLAGPLTLGSDSQINTVAGILTLAGPVQGNFPLTKTGSAVLALAGASGLQFPGPLTVAQGTLRVQNAAGLGSGGSPYGATVNNGATLQLQGGISVSGVPLSLSGAGGAPSGSGSAALENLQGSNSWSGAVTLAADSTVNVDSAADTLTISGNIGGGFGLAKGGAGTLLLAGGNTFTGGISVLAGAVSVANVNPALTVGPLGAGAEAVTLGGNGSIGTLVYTGSAAASDRTFTLGAGTAASTGGAFQVASGLTLSGAIGGNGSLTKTASGMLTLSGSNTYTGLTNVIAGTLAIAPGGSINASSAILIGQGGVLQVTAGSGGLAQLPDAGNVTLGGGTLSYIANGSASAGESVGALALNAGHSQVVLSNAGTGTPYLRFASGTSHTAGATIGFSTTGAQVQFLANPPAMISGILPYAFVGPANSTTVDFATLSTSAGMTVASALTYASSASGDIGSMVSNSTLNAATSGSLSLTATKEFNSLKLANVSSLSMSGTAALTLDSGGLISTGGSATISGGTLSATSGELVINTATDLKIASKLSASSALTKTGMATLTLTSGSPLGGNTFINQGTLAYAHSGNLTYGNVISGPGNLLLSSSSAALTLSGNDTYSGSTTVTAGTLCVNGSLSGGGPVNLQSGAVLSGTGSIAGTVTINSGTITVGHQGAGNWLSVGGGMNVYGSGSLVAGGSAAAISGNLNYTSSASSSFSGTILGQASAVTFNSPAGTILALSGSNQYGGGTLLAGGRLKIGNPAALGSGGLKMTGGTLDLDGSTGLAIASLQGGGVICKSGSGAATLIVGTSAAFTGGYYGTITNGSGVVALQLPDSTTGTLVLSGSNTYSGGTMVYGGELDVEGPAALPAGTSLIVGSGADFSFGGGFAPSFETTAAGAVFDPLAGALDEAPANAGQPAAVPEPGSFILLIAAVVAWGWIRLSQNAASTIAVPPARGR